jgi:hypothetical protein
MKALTDGTVYGINIMQSGWPGLTRKCFELLEKARNNPKGLRFTEILRLCECMGMIKGRTEDSHFIYKLEHPFFLSIQKMKDGKAKAYQVRQLIDFIEEHGLDYLD